MTDRPKKIVPALLAFIILIGCTACAPSTEGPLSTDASLSGPVGDSSDTLAPTEIVLELDTEPDSTPVEQIPAEEVVAPAAEETEPETEPVPAAEEIPAPVTTADAVLTVPEGKEDRIPYLTDTGTATRLTLKKGESLTVAPTETASGIYCTFYDLPATVTVETLSSDGSVLSSEDRDIHSHLYLFPLEDAAALRLTAKNGPASITEVSACTDAFVPPFALEEAKADLLVILPEPGDETKLLGGLLATYAGEKDIRCTVAYLAKRNGYAELEALDALKLLGVQNQPVFLSLDDENAEKSVHILKHMGGEKSVTNTVSTLIGSVAPQVIVIFPEADGDELNNAIAAPVLAAAEKSGARVFISGSGKTVISFDQPLSRYGGKTAAEIADASFGQYTWEHVYRSACPKEIAFTQLGAENASGTDLFAGLTYEPAGNVLPDLSAFGTVNTGVQDTSCFLDYGEPERYTEDYDGGLWTYVGDVLNIRIERKTLPINEEKGTQVVSYIADIRMRDATSYRSGVRATHQQPWKYARLEKAVLAITGDNLDAAEKELKGCLIRNGHFYANYAKQDTCAISADGMSLSILHPNEFSTDSILDSGVGNTFGFGPALVIDGEVQREACRSHRVAHSNPRCGIGMIEPGHWIAICTDGRQAGYSWGIDLDFFAQLFVDLGCTCAYNLDGGSSSAMVFMGDTLTLHEGKGTKDVQRNWNDSLMWGYSDNVPSLDDPIVHRGTRK